MDAKVTVVELERLHSWLEHGVAMLTAIIYQRAAETYPGTVLYMVDYWPAVIRIR